MSLSEPAFRPVPLAEPAFRSAPLAEPVSNDVSLAEPGDLYARWQALRRAKPGGRPVDQSAALGVSEGALAAARCAAGDGVMLRPDAAALMRGAGALGNVMALTRNPHAVLETVGTYADARFENHHAGLVIGPGIDLRIFPRAWRRAFAFEETDDDGTRRSIQAFGADGVAVHKIHLRPDSDVAAFGRLVYELAASDRASAVADAALGASAVADARRAAAVEMADDDVDVVRYRDALATMTDTHEFVPLLRQFGLRREHGLRLARPEFAQPVSRDAHRSVLAAAHDAAVPLMLFVASGGAVEIVTARMPAAMIAGPWYNLMTPAFNLHLREDGVTSAWVVRKPTRGGVVTSLELYDARGELVLQIFGERHAGENERDDWRALVARTAHA